GRAASQPRRHRRLVGRDTAAQNGVVLRQGRVDVSLPRGMGSRRRRRNPDRPRRRGAVIKAFKNFMLRGDVVVVAIGLMVALAFSTLIKAFTDTIINPVLNRFQGRT